MNTGNKILSLCLVLAAFFGMSPEAFAEKRRAEVYYGTAHIDGIKDDAYDKSDKIEVNFMLDGDDNNSKAVCWCLWNDYGLSIFAQVTESSPDSISATLSNRDSFEVFIDENNSRGQSADSDDAQYRVGYDGQKSCGMSASGTDSFLGTSVVTETGYNVEMYIPFKKNNPGAETVMGFEAQVNDSINGKRIGVAKWCDETGDSWQKTVNYGEILLKMGEKSPGDNILVALNGKRMLFDEVEPINIDGRTMVPLRKIFEELNAEIAWYDSTKTVYAIRNGVLIELAIGSDTYRRNGEILTMDVPAVIKDGNTLVPLRVIAESFGAEVSWEDEKSLVKIDCK